MITHQLRVRILGIASIVALLTIVGLTLANQTESQAFALVAGVFGLATAGFFDALGVERRRTNPALAAILDDVRTAPPATPPASSSTASDKTSSESSDA